MQNLWQVVESAALDLGFELVDLERTPGGITRVFIDTLDHERLVTVDDCELLSRQLVHQLPVEGFDFQRLEVSSPGLDRPLTKHAHYERFAGLPIKLRLKMPLEGRRNFEGLLQVSPQGALSLEYEGKGGELLQLNFELDEIERARLVPQVKF
ncbi:MAG: ribosome maturation factor RimP [Burkholderiaceae bacterium]|nr:ribosome maturation factor RimP [Burkholderiaceae bacterium]